MNPSIIKIVFFFMLSVSVAFGQLKPENAQYSTSANDISQQKMIVSIYPSRLLNPRYTGLEVGFELKNNNWLSTEIRATQLFSKSLKDVNGQWNPRITGNILHLEERFNVRGKAMDGPYFALGVSQLWTKYQEVYWYNYAAEIAENTYLTNHYLDTISIQKRYTDVFMKFGYQGIVNRFIVGFDAGIGGRYKDVRHTDLQIEDARIQEPKGINLNYINDQKAYKWVLFIPISFRLGFLL